MVFFTVFNVARLLLLQTEQHTKMSGTDAPRESVRLMWHGAPTKRWSAQFSGQGHLLTCVALRRRPTNSNRKGDIARYEVT